MDVIEDLLARTRFGESVALCTVVAASGSTPHGPGTSMLVTGDGCVVGSISGGCVESEVYELALEVLSSGEPRLVSYGADDESVFSVGLMCGGTIDVFVERVGPSNVAELEFAVKVADRGQTAVLATLVTSTGPAPPRSGAHLVIADRSVKGSLGVGSLDDAVVRAADSLTSSQTLSGPDGDVVFARVLTPKPRMIVFGATDFVAAVAHAAAFTGYRVTVCDARAVFATKDRFPMADDVVVDWPDRYLRQQVDAGLIDARTAICVLTHDDRFDVPLLEVALAVPEIGFVGAMGSRRTHDDRVARLRERGIDDSQLARLSSPIGLDLGGRTPEEIAIAIMAEIISRREGGTGLPLRDRDGDVHQRAGVSVSAPVARSSQGT
ncbi:XdhC family protein [Mycolicibacterium mucogenicum]|uniref:XdhC family protein n=1 Tax=Mycolicibacterium mucogenicum DSM 44124 TaxID=1226753 RepID=A0A8H2JBT1_MYCMU|nr:XdhC family protein [Mycolicibacterium mucogenicum]KAB7760058.1 xanthine dehydrogenase accessory factor [Mycolicibacterium mucogenicum DSM 44124]QPG71246.1 XdhC family protein [Mycolicibacterium mucogenicum DSM 44124]